ncbi:Uncharacterised protein [Serratia rubidaea]|uniref:Uncharacterized protein n=1 Tax=Serratia rubidaea TaxID=61652 RepID=A0A3S4I517_SERRU|nr:Uncharacterised protein [Serratia rubidaea]
MSRQTKIEKCYRKINDAFSRKLGDDFRAKFQREIETRFSIFSMSLVSSPTDGKDFTPEQHAWVDAYSSGYLAAMRQVTEEL